MQLVLQHHLQKELNSAIASFTTPIKPVLQQIRLLTGLKVSGKTCSIAMNSPAAMLQDKLHVFCCPFSGTFTSTWREKITRWSWRWQSGVTILLQSHGKNLNSRYFFWCALSHVWFFSVGENHTNWACDTRTCGSRVGGGFIRAVPPCNVTC